MFASVASFFGADAAKDGAGPGDGSVRQAATGEQNANADTADTGSDDSSAHDSPSHKPGQVFDFGTYTSHEIIDLSPKAEEGAKTGECCEIRLYHKPYSPI